MSADDASGPGVAAGAEIFDIDGILQAQARHELFPTFGDFSSERGRFVRGFGDTAARVQRAGFLHDGPAAERDEKFFGEFHLRSRE